MVRLPMLFHWLLGLLSESLMSVPLVARAQVRMLREGIVEPVLAPDRLPRDLEPTTGFEPAVIRCGLPERGRFGLKDLRVVSDPTRAIR